MSDKKKEPAKKEAEIAEEKVVLNKDGTPRKKPGPKPKADSKKKAPAKKPEIEKAPPKKKTTPKNKPEAKEVPAKKETSEKKEEKTVEKVVETTVPGAKIVSKTKVKEVVEELPEKPVMDVVEPGDEELVEVLEKDDEYQHFKHFYYIDYRKFQYDPNRPKATVGVIVPPGWQDMEKTWFYKVIDIAFWQRRDWEYRKSMLFHNFGTWVDYFAERSDRRDIPYRILPGNNDHLSTYYHLINQLNGEHDCLVIVKGKYKAPINAAIRRAKARGIEVVELEFDEKYRL